MESLPKVLETVASCVCEENGNKHWSNVATTARSGMCVAVSEHQDLEFLCPSCHRGCQNLANSCSFATAIHMMSKHGWRNQERWKAVKQGKSWLAAFLPAVSCQTTLSVKFSKLISVPRSTVLSFVLLLFSDVSQVAHFLGHVAVNRNSCIRCRSLLCVR